jgi:hypothetical protein
VYGLSRTQTRVNTSIHKAGTANQFMIYVPKSKLDDFIAIVKPHIHPTMLYKINEINEINHYSFK